MQGDENDDRVRVLRFFAGSIPRFDEPQIFIFLITLYNYTAKTKLD
jgi:hypothetical protein